MPPFRAAKLTFALIITLGACSVEQSPGNDTVTLSYDEQAARNGVADVAEGAADVANDIRGDVARESQRASEVIERAQGGADRAPAPPAAPDAGQPPAN